MDWTTFIPLFGAIMSPRDRKPVLSDYLRLACRYVYTFERAARSSASGGLLLGAAPPVPTIPTESQKVGGFRRVKDACEDVRRAWSGWNRAVMFGVLKSRDQVAAAAEDAVVAFRTSMLTRLQRVGWFCSLGFDETLRVLNDAKLDPDFVEGSE